MARLLGAVRSSAETSSATSRRAIVFETNRQLAKIGKPVDRGEWGMTPPTVNAYYNPSMNDINFPAGVLMPPLYDAKLDDAPNYGNTGSTIGHELTHGFDDEGRQFDGDGNLRDWWTKKDGVEFEKRANCIRDQYSQYVVVDDIKINGKLTSGEDIADLGGHDPRLGRLEGSDQEHDARAGGRAHARAAVLRRPGAVGLRERAPGKPARAWRRPTRTRREVTASTASS